METIKLRGRITETGQLEVDLPEGLPAVEVNIEIEIPANENPQPLNPSSETGGSWGKELVALLNSLDMSDWEAMDIPDTVEWVNEIRRKQWESRWDEL